MMLFPIEFLYGKKKKELFVTGEYDLL